MYGRRWTLQLTELGLGRTPRRDWRQRAAFVVIVLLTVSSWVYLSVVVRHDARALPEGEIVASAPTFGWTEGAFSVSDDGAAQYSVPFWVPEGRGTVEPRLGLSFNSRAGNGLVGVGWSLTGLSSITPCPRTFAQDDYTDGVAFSLNDVYCLDGVRLMPSGPVPPTGSRDFRTEQESFSRVRAYYALVNQVTVLTHFEVWLRDRTKLTFGNTADSRLEAFKLRPGSAPNTLEQDSTTKVTLAWSVSKVEDRNGNAATIAYERVDGSDTQVWHVESRPSSIVYEPNREVKFVYEDRTDKIESYGRGIHTREPKRLSRVQVFGGELDEEADLLREYELDYDNLSITGRSRLISVTEFDGHGGSKKPLTFAWTRGSYDFDRPVVTTINDAGLYFSAGITDVHADNRLLVADVNGDARADLIYPRTDVRLTQGTRQQWRIRLAEGNGFASSAVDAGFQTPTLRCNDPSNPDACIRGEGQVKLIDANGDAKTDVLVWSPMSPTEQLHKWKLYLSNGSAFVPAAQELEEVSETDNDPNPAYFADVDGNGASDYISALFTKPAGDPRGSLIDAPWTYRKNTGVAGPERFSTQPIGTGRLAPPLAMENKVLDANGDGRADLVGSPASGGATGWGLGGVNSAPEERRFASATLGGPAANGAVAADVNGDGLPDSVSTAMTYRSTNPSAQLSELRASLNSGNGFGPYSTSPNNYYEPLVCCGESVPDPGEPEPANPEPDYDRGVRFVDFNGDGADDVLVFRGLAPRQGVDPDPQFGVQLYVWRNGEFERAPLRAYAGDWGTHGVNSQVLDINGDGSLDIVYVKRDNTPLKGHLELLVRRDPPPDRMFGIGNTADRQQVEITYTTLADRHVHTPAPDCVFPVSCLTGGSTVVASHRISTNIESPDAATVAWETYNHSYYGARVDVQGRGWLGFTRHTVTRAATGETTVTELDNITSESGETRMYPKANLPKKVTTTVTTGTGVNAREHRRTVDNKWERRPYPGGSYTVELQRVIETREERPDGDGPWTMLRQHATTTEYDDFGNPDLVTETTTGGRKITVDATFTNDTSSWLIGQLIRTTTTSKRLSTSDCTVAGECNVATMRYEYDVAGNRTVDEVEPDRTELKLTTTTRYGAFGNVTSITKKRYNPERTRVDTFEYDDDNLYVDASVNALLHRTEYVKHSGLGVTTRVTDANNVATTSSYDRFGRLRATYRADGSSDTISHELSGGWHVTVTTSAGGAATKTFADQLGRVRQQHVKAFDGTFAVTYTGFDGLGRQNRVSLPTLPNQTAHTTTTSYDAADRVTAVTAPDGQVRTTYINRVTNTFDAKGAESRTVTNEDGDIKFRYEVDPSSTTNPPAWLVTTFEYGPLGKITNVTLPDNTRQEHEYDVLGRQTKLRDPSSGTTTTQYNPFGEIDTITDGENRVRTLVHDALGRVTSTVTVDGTATNVWDSAEHGKGKLARATSTDGVVNVYTYTEFGQPESTAWTIDGVSYQMAHAYDHLGRPDTLTYPVIPGAPPNSGRFTLRYGYKDTGYLETVRDAAAPPDVLPLWTAQTRDGAGHLTKEQYANGTITNRVFDERTGLLKSTWVTGPDGPANLARVDYNHDANRNVDQRFDVVNGRNLRYEYDDLQRLERWLTINSTPFASGTYTYNSVGRLQSETLNRAGQPAVTTTYTFGANGDPPHAVTGRNNQPYTYDGIGRQTSGGGRTITYTADNHPKTINWGQGQRTDYRYDASGARVKDTDANRTTITIPGLFDRRDRVNATAQVHNVHHVVVDGRVVADVIRIQAHPTAPISDTDTVYLHHDRQGSPILLTNASGREMGSEEGWLTDLAFDPFGQRVDATYQPLGRQHRGGPRLGYTGHEHDDHIGLINMKGRTYDPETRTFLTPDPFLQDPTSSQSYNRYAYVTNNPATRTDPTGFWGRQERIWEGLRTWRIDQDGKVFRPDGLPADLAGKVGLATGTVTLKPAGGAGTGTQAGRSDDDSPTTLNAGQGDTGGNDSSGGSKGKKGTSGEPDWSIFDSEDEDTKPGSEPKQTPADGDPAKEIAPDPDAGKDLPSRWPGGTMPGVPPPKGFDDDPDSDIDPVRDPKHRDPRSGPGGNSASGRVAGGLGLVTSLAEIGTTISDACQGSSEGCAKAFLSLAAESLTGVPITNPRDPTVNPIAFFKFSLDHLTSHPSPGPLYQDQVLEIMGGKGWDMTRQ